ncbi:Hypothetical protein R9X50_00582600 [Acrodontium crateriforme]|uniref:Transcription factor Iwr1 domain-containing protein n=1 Tax=Acrodontium crateriforme TaxID=150365 RepID=A0AAQ3R9F1_9PEZI|nr:Hypothetical protein R9X50_00582600 [Acrodontium crateriforme]
MSAPNRIRLKRRRDELPPNTLVIEERRQKRTQIDRLYVRHQDEQEAPILSQTVTPSENGNESQNITAITGRRIFQLTRKKIGRDDAYATIVEKRAKQAEAAALGHEDGMNKVETLKRPGKGSSTVAQPKPEASRTALAELEKEQEYLESIGSELHRIAMEELAQERRPRTFATPRLAGSRSREIHRQRAAAAPQPRIRDEDIEMEDENGAYVYDTYILAGIPTGGIGESPIPGAGGQAGDVGYVIITEEDQEIWEHYIEDEPSDKDWDTDEDDENAEGYYGADYPEDELASDDEHGREIYRYRHHGGSDDEEWDEDTGAYSDDDENDFMGKEWRSKTPAQFVDYLKKKDAAG